MKRHSISTSDQELKKQKHCNNQETPSIDNIELTLSLPQQLDLDYIEQNGLIITKDIDAEAIQAVEEGGSYVDEDDDTHIPLILLHNKKIVSYMLMTISSNNLTIDWLATAPDDQGKGFAKLLILTVLNMIKDYGVEQIDLISSEVGFPLYVKCGFLPTNKELLPFLERGQNLLTSITQMKRHAKDMNNLDLCLDLSDIRCKTTLENYLAVNSTMLSKVNFDLQVQTIIKQACVIENSSPSSTQGSGQERSSSPSIHFSSVNTFFSQEKMTDIELLLKNIPMP